MGNVIPIRTGAKLSVLDDEVRTTTLQLAGLILQLIHAVLLNTPNQTASPANREAYRIVQGIPSNCSDDDYHDNTDDEQ